MVDITEVFSVRAVVMKSVPRFLAGVFRGALKAGLQEICKGRAANNVVAEERGWKLFLLIPRLLLWRPPRCLEVAFKNDGGSSAMLERSLEAAMQGKVQETSYTEGHIGEKGCQGHGTCTVRRVVHVRHALEGEAVSRY